MVYSTTKLTPVKSYPTYQLHAYTCGKLGGHDCFKVCILETFRWLRMRLVNFSELNEMIMTPEPENYADLSDGDLRSFSINSGFTLDVTYIEKAGVWSFCLSEADMGVNHDQPNERKAVQGRIFTTEISFRKLADCVEVGVRTTCSEPADSDADCEVFRPTLVKMLALNPGVGLKNHYIIDGKTVNIATKGDADNLVRVLGEPDYDLPVMLVAEAPFVERELPAADIGLGGIPLNLAGLGTMRPDMQNMAADMSKLSFGLKMPVSALPKPEKDKPKPKKTAPPVPKEPRELAEIVDHESLAKSLMGFVTVCFVSEAAFRTLKNKLGVTVSRGDVKVLIHGDVVAAYDYSEYKKDVKKFTSELRADMKLMPKRRQFSYGSVLFSSDARLLEIEEKRSDKLTVAEQMELLTNENDELKKKIRELVHRETDNAQTSDTIRTLQKNLARLQDEKDAAETLAESYKSAHEAIIESYRNEAARTEFYRRKSRIALSAPTDKDDVCGWIEENFADSLIVSPRAKSSLGKYAGAMDVSSLCDGIYYLHGYNLYRNGEISKEELELYGADGSWEVSGCGGGTMQMCKSDYTVSYNGKQYQIDLHIKRGVGQHLIRIYFCRLEDEKKLLIGYMPDHLSTSRRKT